VPDVETSTAVRLVIYSQASSKIVISVTKLRLLCKTEDTVGRELIRVVNRLVT